MTRANKTRSKRRVLVVDDDDNLRRLFEYNLGKWGYKTSGVENGAAMLSALASSPYDLILLDIRLPDGDGIDFLATVREAYPYAQVIMVTAHGSVEMAMDAVRLGAYDFLTKPVDLDRLLVAARNAVKLARREAEYSELQSVVAGRSGLGSLIGASQSMQTVYEVIANVAASDCSVLITGATSRISKGKPAWIIPE